MSGGAPVLLPHVGLCSICQHTKRVDSARGSAFFLCTLARTNPAFPKYPRLPVLACRGFEPQRVEMEPPESSSPTD